MTVGVRYQDDPATFGEYEPGNSQGTVIADQTSIEVLDSFNAISSQSIDGLDRAVERCRGRDRWLLPAACPLRGPIPQLTAWTMTRVNTFAGRAYQQLMAGLGVLLAAVIIATALLVRLTVTWSRHVRRIERSQAGDELRLPPIGPSGEKELDQIIDVLNRAGSRLAKTGARAEQLSRQVATGERLAAIGRVAVGVAHEILNPIAAMRLKAGNALLAGALRQKEALSMILGQIERLDRRLTRLCATGSGRCPSPCQTRRTQ